MHYIFMLLAGAAAYFVLGNKKGNSAPNTNSGVVPPVVTNPAPKPNTSAGKPATGSSKPTTGSSNVEGWHPPLVLPQKPTNPFAAVGGDYGPF